MHQLSRIRPNDMNDAAGRPATRQAIIDGAVAAMWLPAWAMCWEAHGGRFRPGQKIDLVAPPAPLISTLAGAAFIGALEECNDSAAMVLLDRARRADERASFDEAFAHEFGWYAAMEATGHGVSWFDSHAKFPLRLPSRAARNAEDAVEMWLHEHGPRIPYNLRMTASCEESDTEIAPFMMMTFEEADAVEIRLHEIAEWMDSNGFPVLHGIRVDPAPHVRPGRSPEGLVTIVHEPKEGCARLSAALTQATGIHVDPAMLQAALDDAASRSFPDARSLGDSLSPGLT